MAQAKKKQAAVTKSDAKGMTADDDDDDDDDNEFFDDAPSQGEGGGGGMVMDLSDTSDELPSFDPVPPGVYPVFLQEADFGQSQRSGKDMVTWVFEIPEGHEYGGRRFWYHTVLEKTGLNRLKRLLVRIAPDVDLSAFDPETTPQTLLGKRAQAKVGMRMYQGEKTNNVKDILPPKDGEDPFFDDDE